MFKSKHRILIIDDSAEDREMYRQYLAEDKGTTYEFEECEMAAEGLMRALNENFDCILLDYGMPDSDGITVLESMIKQRPNDYAPVVMVTGQGNEDVAVRALRLGADDYLVKSQITPEAMYRATHNAIEKNRNALLLKEETEKRLRTQEHLSILVDGARDHALILLDSEGNISTWNSGASTLTGYSESDVLGRHVNLLYRDEDQQRNLASKELAFATRSGKIDLERWLVKKNGEEFWATGSISLLAENGGLTRGFAKIIRNDTAKKRLLEERVSREKWLEMLLDSIPVAFVLFERQTGRLLFSNRTANQLVNGHFPYSESREDFVRNYPLRSGNNESFTDINHPWVRAMDGERLNSLEVIWELAESTVNLSMTSEELPPLSGREPTVIISLHDISALKQMQIELEDSKFVAESATNAKSQFLANMSHEIRTPLGVVMGFAELATRTTIKPEDRARFIDIIKRNGKILTQLIDGILDLSKIEAGRLALSLESLDLNIFASDILDVYASQATAKQIYLHLTLDENLPTSIQTDSTRLKQIIYNLVGNAIKFTETGGVTLSIEPIHDPVTKQKNLAFTVIDTGIGISAEHVNALFKPFMQADSSITRKYGGTGLGLMLCAKLSDLLGGTLELQHSVPGEGSQFCLTIPLQSLGESNIADIPALINHNSIRGKHLLVVEDSADALEFIQDVLTSKGALVSCASDGPSGLLKIAQQDFDLVIMDVQMGEMDGYTATRKMRELGFTRPIIGLSANVFHEYREKGLAAGMDEYLHKPIQVDDLLNRLAWWLDTSRK